MTYHYCIPMRVARVIKFKINVTSHLKIIIFIIKDIQISKCDIIFENGRFSAFEGVGVPILSHPYGGILSHFSDNVTGGRNAIITVWLINIHYWQFYNLIFIRLQAIIWNLMNRGMVFLTN